MPVYLYKPANNTQITLAGTNTVIPALGVSFNEDNIDLNGYVPVVLHRYIDSVLSNEIVENSVVSPVLVNEQKGSKTATITNNTVAVFGKFSAITVIADTVFTTLTRANTTGTFGSIVVPVGVTIFGDITGYQLASGVVIAYGV